MESIANFVLVGLKGKSLDDAEREFLKTNTIAGIVLKSENFESPAQLAEFINSIQALRREQPFIIGCEMWSREKCHFQTHYTSLPSTEELATANSPKMTYELFSVVTKELKACGVNLNFAPQSSVLLDESLMSAAVRGIQTQNMISCMGDFPQALSSSKDIHIFKKTKEEIEKNYLPEFIKASKARIECIQFSHTICDEIDPDLPSSMSKKVVNFFREKTKFKGLIISDDFSRLISSSKISSEKMSQVMADHTLDLYRIEDIGHAQKLIELADKKLKELGEKLDFQDSIKRLTQLKVKYLEPYETIYIPNIKKSFSVQDSQKIVAFFKDSGKKST